MSNATAARAMALVSLLCLAVAGTAKGEDGMTPLHKAAPAGDVVGIEAPLAIGADVNAKTKDGSTPSGYARRGMETTTGSIAPFQEAIEILKAHGAR